jgi:SAM-dependent methyltransferase
MERQKGALSVGHWYNRRRMIWPLGAYPERARDIERVDSHDVTDEELNAFFDFSDAVARHLGGHSVILRFLASAARAWNGPITVLDLGCGRGGLSRSIVDWARRRGLEVKVHGADRYGRLVHLARDHHRGISDLTFETRDLKDPFYLQAQQFDYVVSAHAMHREPDDRTVAFLKTANRQARRGMIVVDWLRDARAACYLAALARFSKDETVREDIRLAVRRGFLSKEADALRQEAGLDFAKTHVHLGYRFSIGGERALVMGTELSPVAGLAT